MRETVFRFHGELNDFLPTKPREYVQQFLQAFAAFDACATFFFIDKGSDDTNVVSRRIKSDCGRLIGDRVLLVLCTHTQVLSGSRKMARG